MHSSINLIKIPAPVYCLGFWYYRLHGSSIWLHYFALGNKSGGFCEAVNCERSEQEGKFLSAYLNGSLYLIKFLAPVYGSSIWLHYFALGNKSGGFCEAVNCERSEQEGKFLFAYLNGSSIWLHYFALGNKSGGFCEAVNCERSEQEGKFLFAYLNGSSIWLHYFALGNKSSGFCEAVNCERNEQEGKFLFAYLMVPTTF